MCISRVHAQANANKVQKRLINKPQHPAELAADIVERVAAIGGDPYLNTKQRDLSWWQLSLLDVKLFLAIVVTLAVGLLIGMLWFAARLVVTAGKCIRHAQTDKNGQKKVQ